MKRFKAVDRGEKDMKLDGKEQEWVEMNGWWGTDGDDVGLLKRSQ